MSSPSRSGAAACLLAGLTLLAVPTAARQRQWLDSKPRLTTAQVRELVAREVRTQLQPLAGGLTFSLDTPPQSGDGRDLQLGELTSRVDRQASLLRDVVRALDQVQSQTTSQQDQISLLTDRLQRAASEGQFLPRDCSDLTADAQTGVYVIQPGLDRSQPPVAAFCDQRTDAGGWTVIQRRADIQPRLNFSRSWAAYREGFGELDAEFWWGLQHLSATTSARDRRYELRIDLEDFEGEERFVVYRGFRVSSEDDGYRLMLGNYSGEAGDSLRYHDDMKFSTYDKDQDLADFSCAQASRGGWWYKGCFYANLNGLYQNNPAENYDGIEWRGWKGAKYSMKKVEMKIRPIKDE